MIKIIGLGPGSPEALTLGTINILKEASKVYFRTEKHPTIDYIKALNISYETYDFAYDKYDSFEEVYGFIAKDIVDKYKEDQNIIYGVPGHPFVAEQSVKLIIDKCKDKNIEYKVYPAVSFVDTMMEALGIDPVEGLKIIDAFDIKNQVLDKRVGMVITQVYDKYIASEVKLQLSEYYNDDMDIFFVRAAGIKGLESIRKIKLYEIDRQEDIDYLTSLYIPKDCKTSTDFNDLLKIMEVLRSPDGCPWDREQTIESLKKYIIEECYEAVEAIEEQDDNKIIEELGDLLLQIVFVAQIAKEDGYFSIKDIVESICEKMVIRHPHVFGNIKVKDSEEVLANWDNIKKEEQGHKSHTEEMRHIAKTLPALIRAQKVQSKAAKVGFDWNNVEDAMKKVKEEFYEVKDVYKGQDVARILEEIGDLFFAVVNVARFLNVDSEEALSHTTEKFIKRFSYIEENALKSSRNLEDMTLDEMDELWNLAKNHEKK